MKIKNIYEKNRLLMRLIILYLIISVVFTGILMGAVSEVLSTRTEEKISDSSQELMNQSYKTSHYALTNIYGDFNVLYSGNTSINKALNEEEILEKDISIASRIIESIVFRDDLVDSVYIINKKADLVISNLKSPDSIDDFYDQYVFDLLEDYENNYSKYIDEDFFPRKTSYTLYGKEFDKKYVSLIYADKEDGKSLESALIVNIDQDKLSELINIANKKGFRLITNNRGEIISDSRGLKFSYDMIDRDIYNLIENNPNREDGFIGDYINSKSFITYQRAEDIGFIFISVMPYSYIISEISQINTTMLILFLISMLVNLLVGLYAIKRIYAPLYSLIKDMKKDLPREKEEYMDEYDFLGKTYNDLILENKRASIIRIFEGNYTDASLETLEFTRKKFMSLSIKIDYEEDELYKHLEGILKILDSHTNWHGAITSKDQISCIINDNKFDDLKMDSLMETIVSFQEVVSEELGISVSIGIGSVVNSIESIKFSHRYSNLALNYALSLGGNQVVLYSEIEDTKLAASQNRDSVAGKIEKYILDNYHRQDFSAAEVAKEVDLSLGYARQIFKKEKGITLNDFIIKCRIKKAKELLVDTDDTAKNISEAVGYYDNRYFYTLFKKNVGMTTEEFRNYSRENNNEN